MYSLYPIVICSIHLRPVWGVGCTKMVLPLSAEFDPLLGEGSTPARSPSTRSKSIIALAVGGLALFALGTEYGRNTQPGDVAVLDKTGYAPVPSSDGMSGIMAINENIAQQGALGKAYPWMDGLIVEPYYETTFIGEGSGDRLWTVTNADSGEVVVTTTAAKLAHTFTALGKYTIAADEAVGILHVKYVRHEIRSLTEGARARLFKAWAEVIAQKDEKSALTKYGSNFMTLRKLSALHNNWGGAKDCDHLHDGMGFVPTHVQMNQIFEESLQVLAQPSPAPLAHPRLSQSAQRTLKCLVNKTAPP